MAGKETDAANASSRFPTPLASTGGGLGLHKSNAFRTDSDFSSLSTDSEPPSLSRRPSFGKKAAGSSSPLSKSPRSGRLQPSPTAVSVAASADSSDDDDLLMEGPDAFFLLEVKRKQ